MEKSTVSIPKWLFKLVIILVIVAIVTVGTVMVVRAIPSKEERIANRVERCEQRFLDQKGLVAIKTDEYNQAAAQHQTLVDSLRGKEDQQRAKINGLKDELQELIAPYKIKIASNDEVMKAINVAIKEVEYGHDPDLQRLVEQKRKEIAEANDELLIIQKEYTELMKDSEDALNKQARKLAKAESKMIRLERHWVVVRINVYTDDIMREVANLLRLKQAEVEEIQLQPYGLQGELSRAEQKLVSLQAELDQMKISRDKNKTGFNRANRQIVELEKQINELKKVSSAPPVKVVVVQPRVVEPVKTEAKVVPFATHLDEIKVIVPNRTIRIWGDAIGWPPKGGKNVVGGFIYIPAREGSKLLINGLMENNVYLDASSGITLISPDGSKLVLNRKNALTADKNGHPNFQYSYINGKLNLVP